MDKRPAPIVSIFRRLHCTCIFSRVLHNTLCLRSEGGRGKEGGREDREIMGGREEGREGRTVGEKEGGREE